MGSLQFPFLSPPTPPVFCFHIIAQLYFLLLICGISSSHPGDPGSSVAAHPLILARPLLYAKQDAEDSHYLGKETTGSWG